MKDLRAAAEETEIEELRREADKENSAAAEPARTACVAEGERISVDVVSACAEDDEDAAADDAADDDEGDADVAPPPPPPGEDRVDVKGEDEWWQPELCRWQWTTSEKTKRTWNIFRKRGKRKQRKKRS